MGGSGAVPYMGIYLYSRNSKSSQLYIVTKGATLITNNCWVNT